MMNRRERRAQRMELIAQAIDHSLEVDKQIEETTDEVAKPTKSVKKVK